jgi:uncharacterized LabA/DUF88 family protein
MKLMVFVDFENFRKSVSEINITRQAQVKHLADFIIEHLHGKLGWEKYNLRLIRTYVYTGEYATTTISRIKKHLVEEQNTVRKQKIQIELEKAERRREGQKDFFYKANDFDFFELRTKPLQYSDKEIHVFQKGVDVQIAVDLLAFAHNNSYDVAVLCSGDVDLLESIKMVKNLGKKIIILSHSQCMAKEIRKYADHVINLKYLTPAELDRFSYLPTTPRPTATNNQITHHPN